LLNLYSNAIKFTDRFGKIVIVVEKVKYSDNGGDESQINSATFDMIIISVIDSGIGIKEEDKDKLFKLFGSMKDEKH